MSTLKDLLDAAKAVTGSDYKTAKALGITPARLGDWRGGRQNPQPEDYALIAAIAGQDPEVALVRATIAKHADTPKGERLLSALGKAWRQTGAVATSLALVGAGCFSVAWGLVKDTTMYRKVNSRPR